MTDVNYTDGFTAFLAMGALWLLVSFELAVIVGLAWAIAGISKSNATTEAQATDESDRRDGPRDSLSEEPPT